MPASIQGYVVFRCVDPTIPGDDHYLIIDAISADYRSSPTYIYDIHRTTFVISDVCLFN